MMENAMKRLCEKGIRIEKDLSLSAACTFRVGGMADLGIYPVNEEELCLAVSCLQNEGVPFEVIGKGSNLLFGDGHLEGALILCEGMNRIEKRGQRLLAQCGVSLASLAAFAAEYSLTGLEFARGIPGTVGGAIFMNAGAYGSSMERVVVSSRALDRITGEIFTITDHGFGYRKSIYMERPELICLEAELELTEGDREAIEATMRELSAKRRASQPLEFPSAGSYFKRPEGYFAGKLIEDAGLKGRTVGGACVSEKHAGFLINLGGATASDLLMLEEIVRNEVREKYGVTLEREVRFLPTT
jgi:UDP-N-acetylmuramate dehydrogenase